MEEIKEQYKGRFLAEHDPSVQQVKRVMERLLPYAEKAGLRDVDWEVHVIDAPDEQNAFVIPGYDSQEMQTRRRMTLGRHADS